MSIRKNSREINNASFSLPVFDSASIATFGLVSENRDAI